MYTIRKSNDRELFISLYKQLFPSDALPKASDYWIVCNENKKPVGFASAIRDTNGNIFLSSAGVFSCARGNNLQRRLINARVKWAKKKGARRVYTYTLLKNYPSIINLIKCGFSFYEPHEEGRYVGNNVHYFRKII